MTQIQGYVRLQYIRSKQITVSNQHILFLTICLLCTILIIYLLTFSDTTVIQQFQQQSENYTKSILNNEREIKNLSQNEVFRNFEFTYPIRRTKVNVLLIVSSAPARSDRRKAIRETWWPDCQNTERISIKCVFLTDFTDANSEIGQELTFEKTKFKDLHFQNLIGGLDFDKRFLFHMMWGMINYKFDYFVRMDDDYFLCMKRFLAEVPMPPRRNYHWGWVHCLRRVVRPDESIILLSEDLIKLFVSQDPRRMLCTKWTDQMIGLWKKELNLKNLFYNHDPRLHHHPPAKFVEEFETRKNICHDFIGLHGSYPLQMRILWKNRGNATAFSNKKFTEYTSHCNYVNEMLWDNIGSTWKAEPKLCLHNPNWGGKIGQMYLGRETQYVKPISLYVITIYIFIGVAMIICSGGLLYSKCKH